MALHEVDPSPAGPVGLEGVETYPWWIRNDEVIIGYIAVGVSLWFLWALFRAAGVPRKGLVAARPPTCEYCGYNLTGTPIEGRCPECGVPAVMSLGPDACARARLTTEQRKVGSRRCSDAGSMRFCARKRLDDRDSGDPAIEAASALPDRGFGSGLHRVHHWSLPDHAVGTARRPGCERHGRDPVCGAVRGVRRPAGVLVLAMLIAGAVGTFLLHPRERTCSPPPCRCSAISVGFCWRGSRSAGSGVLSPSPG